VPGPKGNEEMATPDTNHAVEKTPVEASSGTSGVAETLPSPEASPILAKAKEHNIRVSPAVLDAAAKEGDELLQSLRTAPEGLTQAEAEERTRTSGPNEVAQERRRGWFIRLLIILRNPLVILLAILSSISFATGDARAGSVMAGMVVLSVVLRFVQEARADSAAAKLKAMIHVTATVVRDGKARELPLRDLVPGDIINLSAGDMIPGDVRVIAAKDLFVSQGTLTGESLPVEKFHDADPKPVNSPVELKNICFMGTSVQSGTATAVIVVTGVHTYLGTMASSITEEEPPTSFDKGLSRFTWLMIQIMAVMVPLVFVINGFTKHDLRDGRGRGADSGDAADDCFGLPLQGRACHEPQEGDRQAPQLHPELRWHGRALRRQDRHAD
jgi:Mg2+-importing ATPase